MLQGDLRAAQRLWAGIPSLFQRGHQTGLSMHLVAAWPEQARCAAALTNLHVQRHEKTIIFCERPAPLSGLRATYQSNGRIRTESWEAPASAAPACRTWTDRASSEAGEDPCIRKPDGVPAICLSSVGDEAIDLPNAQVLSSSRRPTAPGDRRRSGWAACYESTPTTRHARVYQRPSSTRSSRNIPWRWKKQGSAGYLRTQGYRIVKADWNACFRSAAPPRLRGADAHSPGSSHAWPVRGIDAGGGCARHAAGRAGGRA